MENTDQYKEYELLQGQYVDEMMKTVPISVV